MINLTQREDYHTISPKIRLISVMIIHCCVETPFFIYPVIVLLIGNDIFGTTQYFWVGLGSIGTIGSLASGLPSPYFGRLLNKYRESSLLIMSLILAALGTLLVGLFGSDLIIMTLGMILMGISLALYHPVGLAWLSSSFEDSKTKSYSPNYVKVLSLHGVGGSIGVALGPLSVHFLLNKLSWQQIYLFWSFPLLIVAFLFWIFVGRFVQKKEVITSSNFVIKNNKKNLISKQGFINYLPLFLIFSFIFTMSMTIGMINFILSPFLSEIKGVEIATAALFIGISFLIGATGQIIGGYFGDRFGENSLLSSLALTQSFVILGIYFIKPEEFLLLFYIILGISMASFWPSSNSLVAKNAQNKGIAFGFVMLVANLLGAIGPFLDGILISIDPNSYMFIFLFSSIFPFLGFCSLFALKILNKL